MTPFEKLTIDLSPGSLADKYTVDHLTNAPIGTAFAGLLYGWPWGLTVRGRNNTVNGRYQLTGDYDVSELLKQYLSFSTSLTSASAIMGAVATQIGKTLSVSIDDHSVNSLTNETTLQDVVSGLFDWTAAVPHRYVNVFLRGSVLHVLQRGKESSVYTPVKYEIDNDNDVLVDTLMDTSLNSPKITGDSITYETGGSSVYMSGTFQFGNASVTFANGLNVQTVEDADDGTTTTTNSFDANRYIMSKTVTAVSGANTNETTTTYSYGTYQGLPYMSSCVDVSKKNGDTKQKTETNYAPLGFDFYGQHQATYRYVTVDGVQTWKRTSDTSSVSEGRPGGQASPYTISKEATSSTSTPSVSIARNPISSSHVPATDTATLQRYATGLEWLDGKTKRTVRLRCWDEHVIDYTERVSLMGLEWYLNDNQITVSGTKIEQSVELVRWS